MKIFFFFLVSYFVGCIIMLMICWLVVCCDGYWIGFIDYDCVLMIDGIVCQLLDGIMVFVVSGGLVLVIGGGEIVGVLGSLVLVEYDLEVGFWDYVEIQIYLVNWQLLVEYYLLSCVNIGEVICMGGVFWVELCGLVYKLKVWCGWVFLRICDVDLGDVCCMVQLVGFGFEVNGFVQELVCEWVLVDGLDGFFDGWFFCGWFEVLSGLMVGFVLEIVNY